MEPRATIQAVAKLAKVSPATVSRIINRTTRVSSQVESRVREAAEQLGFDMRRKGNNRLIAYLLSNRSLLHPFHSQVLIAAEAYCAEQDYSLLFFPLHYPPSQHWTKLHVPRILQRGDLIDGFVAAGVNYQNLLDLLEQSRLPFSVLGDTVQGDWKDGNYDVVGIDDTSGAYDVTRYLIGAGFGNIAFVGNVRLAWFRRRHEGYLRAMSEANLAPMVYDTNSSTEYEVGVLSTKQALSNRTRPLEAIFAGSDAICHGVYAAVREAGLRIPDDISVCGFNDTPEATVLYPPLTSVRVFPDLIGRQLGEMVVNRIASPGLRPQRFTIPTQLIKRESVLPSARVVEIRAAR